MVLPVRAEMGDNPTGGNNVSQGDVSPGDVTPGDVTPGDVTSGDVAEGTIAYYFPDDQFAASVAGALGKETTDTITQDELDGLTDLEFVGVRNWQGIERLPNLWNVNISRLNDYDIKFLDGLSNVQNLHLWLGWTGAEGNTLIGDIKVLSNFTGLRKLFLGENASLTGELSSLPNTLEVISGWADGITGTLADIEDMQSLSDFSLWTGAQIGGDTSSLKKLVNLEDLALYSTKVSIDLSDFIGMTKLKSIRLIPAENAIKGSLSAFSNLADLECLDIYFNENDDVDGNIETLTNLKKLKALVLMYNTNITGDIINLSGLTQLEALNLGGSGVEGNVSSIAGLTNITSLSLSGTKITGDIRSLANMPLTDLDLWDTQMFGNLSDLGKKDNLTALGLRRTAIRVNPEDQALFPNLEPVDDIFVAPEIDEQKSQLAYQPGFADYISISTNKSREGFEKLLIDGEEFPMFPDPGNYEYQLYGFDFDHSWDFEPAPINNLRIWGGLDQLDAGEHTATLVYYWGGSVSTTFTVSQTTVTYTINDLFPDDEFAAAVADWLEKEVTDTVKQDELDQIDHLILNGVTDWQGLDYLPNLCRIIFETSGRYDIANLEGLKNVQNLDLSLGSEDGNMFGDIDVLSDFIDLKGLFVGDSSLTGELSSLPNTLESLFFQEDGITGTLAALEGMKNLRDLQFWLPDGQTRGSISGSTSSLAGLRNLETLILNDGMDINLSDFSELTKLTSIFLGTAGEAEETVSGSLSDLSKLADLEGFSLWSLVDHGVTGDLAEFAADHPKLTGLTIQHQSGITGELADLCVLTELTNFMIDSLSVTGDISSIAGMKNLSSIVLYTSEVKGDIGSLAKLPLTDFNLTKTLVSGNLSDLGSSEDLTGISLRGTPVRVKPEDQALFPNFVTEDDLFVAPVIDVTNSKLTYQHGLPDQEGNYILISTNKSREGFAKLLIDGVEVPMVPNAENTDITNYDFEHEEDCWIPVTIPSDVMIWGDYLDQLAAGEHTVTLDYYWGGSVSTTFTVAETFYTVQFVDADGRLIAEQAVVLGSDAVAPTAPAREGYTFTGWDKVFTDVTTNLVVKAQYRLNCYAVTFHDWDGTVLKSQIVDHGAAAQAPKSPSREGYGFTGWNVAFSNVTKNLDVTATYQANLFTVTFLDVDGTELEKQTVEYGKPATAPADPTRQGYEFIGWDVGFAIVTGDMTVTAMYHELGGDTYIINQPGVVDGNTLKDYDVIIVQSPGVTIDGGKLRGNIRIEAQQVTLKNLDIAGKVEVLAKECTITDCIIRGSFTAAAESITMRGLDIRGNLSIGATNITLEDSEVRGNITIERTVGNGHVVITNVKSKGNILYVKGGGSNSIVLTNAEIGAIVIDKVMGTGQQAVRVAVEGTTQVANTIVNSAAIIEDRATTGSGIENVTLSTAIPAASTVELRGTIKAVTVEKEALKVVNNAVVEKIDLEASSITLVNNASVAELNVGKDVDSARIEGEKIENINVANGGEQPVYVPTPTAPSVNNDGKSQEEQPTQDTSQTAEVTSPKTNGKEARGFVWVGLVSTVVGCMVYRKLKRKSSQR
jgi:Leucine-rich repeat (LRR) protein